MATMAGALAAVSVFTTVASTAYSFSVARANAKRETQLAEVRADERRDQLRKVIAAQRVGLAEQGRDPFSGTSLTLQQEAVKSAGKEQWADDFQTGARVQNYQAEGMTSVLNGIGKASGSVMDYYNANRQTKLGKQGG